MATLRNSSGGDTAFKFRPIELLFACVALVVLECGVLKAADKAVKAVAKSTASSKAADKPDADDDPTGPSDLEMDDDLTALIVPAEQLGAVKGADRTKFSLELRSLLAEGMGVEGENQAARRHFEAAHRLVPADPRAAYAYGVALLAQSRGKESLEQFRAAAQQSKAPFLPALEAIAWVNISRKDYAKGLPAILDLARKIEETKETWPTDHDRQRSAEWLGRMVGFLAGPGKPSEFGEAIDKLDADVEKRLTFERKAAFENGRKFVAGRHESLKALLARPMNEVLDELKQKRQEILDAARAAESEVKALDDEMRAIKKPHDEQIADLNHDIRLAAQKSKRAQRDLPEAEELVEYLSVPQVGAQVRYMTRYRTRIPVGVTPRPETAQEKKAREAQLATAKQNLEKLEAAHEQAIQEVSDLKSQKEKADADYRREAAEKRPLLAAARRKAQEMTARAKEMDHGGLTPEKLKARVTALDSYVSLDPETEKNRLLATFKSPG